MPDWIQHPHAGFVMAAYAVAAIALIGIGITSVCESRRRSREWQALTQKKTSDSQ